MFMLGNILQNGILLIISIFLHYSQIIRVVILCLKMYLQFCTQYQQTEVEANIPFAAPEIEKTHPFFSRKILFRF
jgi:hypothetical protein